MLSLKSAIFKAGLFITNKLEKEVYALKVNIRKGLKVVLPLLVVAFMVFCLLPTSVYASSRTAYKASDYISNIVVDGNTKTVFFDFQNLPLLTNVWPQGIGTKEQFEGAFAYSVPQGADGVHTRTYYGGVQAFENEPAPLSGIIDVSDIMPGATFTLSMSYSFTFTIDADHPEVTATIGHGYFAYDKNGVYLGQYFGKAQSQTFSAFGEDDWIFTADTDFTIAGNVSYIIPISNIRLNFDTLLSTDFLSFRFGLVSLRMSTDVNMIYSDSETGKQISDKLDEIIDGPSDVTGDVDDIVGGTSDQKDKVDNLLDEMNQMNKPDPGDIDVNINNIVDSNGSQYLHSSVGSIAHHSLVQTILMIVGTILVLSYVLFGKRR